MDRKRIIIICIIVLAFISAIILSIIHYNGKYSIYFETGTNDVFLTRYVNKNGKVNEPIEPTKEGYVFKEWQLNGKKYDFNSEVNSNTVLTAKWIKEEYVTINFDTQTEQNIESKKILKGESITDLPVLYKDEYDFIGWFLDDKLYVDEEIYDDITLIAKFEIKKPDIKYEVGDVIKIVGNYSESAYSNYEYHSAAIGWEREIIDIIEGSEFPYAVGYSNEITGYFKQDSIEKI